MHSDHRVPSSKEDFIMLVTELKKLSLFSDIPSMSYPMFSKLKNVLHGNQVQKHYNGLFST